MNLEQVAHYIAHPHELGLAEAPALKSMSEKHPYAAVFSLLYLTALANGKSVDLDDALQQHAYKLSDRTKLYHLLHGDQEVSSSSEPVSIEETSASLFEPAYPADRKEMKEVTEPEIEPATPEETIVPAVSANPVEAITSEEATPPDLPSRGEAENIPASENFERITEAFTREQHFEVEPQSDEAPDTGLETAEPEETSSSLLEEKNQPEAGEDEVVSTAADSAETVMREATESFAEPEIIREEVIPLDPSTNAASGWSQSSPVSDELFPSKGEAAAPQPEPKRSFTSWLKSGDHSPEAHEEDTSATERATLVVPVSNDVEPEPLKRKVDDIIDNFIKEEPTITRGKTEFYSPSRKAKESLDEEALPVSETLAKIFAAQGNYPKAIHVYHQLMLSFPEKKSFFAIQIEALKKKITP